ncbi:MAG: glycosyltransferase [Chloroflexota bacterium]
MDKSKTPKVSVMMAVYNGEATVGRAIEGILAQSFTDFEFIIVDDGSSDETLPILHDYATRDTRIRLIVNEHNLGLTKSLNKGVEQAHGQYIARQDADDTSHPERFGKQVSILDNNPNEALVTSHFVIDDSQGEHLYRHHPSQIQRRWAMLFHNYISGHSGVMFRKDVFDNLGGYDETFRYAQDYDLWERLLREHSIAVVEQTLFTMYFHDTNISKTKLDQQTNFALEVSQRQLRQLIGEIDLTTVRELYHFWVYRHDEVTDYQVINQYLKQIFEAFMARYAVNSDEQEAIRLQICHRLWEGGTHNKSRNWGIVWLVWQWSPRFVLTRIKKQFRLG